MKSPEDVPQIVNDDPQPRSEATKQWLEKLVSKGQASSSEEALLEMQQLLDSVVSPESKINQLIEKKIKDILELDSPLIDAIEREEVIIQKLAEIFQERPELLAASGFSLDLGSQWKERLVMKAEYKKTYTMMMRALCALAKKYEKDSMRQEFTQTILDAYITDMQRDIEPMFLEGTILRGIDTEDRLDYEKLSELSQEAHDVRPSIRSILQELTPENVREVKQEFDRLMREVVDSVDAKYPYLRGIEHQTSHNYEPGDKSKRTAIHVTVTASTELTMLRNDGSTKLKYILLGDCYEIRDMLESYICIEKEQQGGGYLASKSPEDTLTWIDVKNISRAFYPFQEELEGHTVDDAKKMLLDKIKSF